jgi:hypothetical protein
MTVTNPNVAGWQCLAQKDLGVLGVFPGLLENGWFVGGRKRPSRARKNNTALSPGGQGLGLAFLAGDHKYVNRSCRDRTPSTANAHYSTQVNYIYGYLYVLSLRPLFLGPFRRGKGETLAVASARAEGARTSWNHYPTRLLTYTTRHQSSCSPYSHRPLFPPFPR